MEDFVPVKPFAAGVPHVPDARYHVEAAWSEAGESEWRTPAAGLRVRDLFDDGEGYRVALVRLEPGAALPVPLHPADEHIFVLAGKIRDSGAGDGAGEYGAGTYLMNPAGSHGRPYSRGGCLAIVHWHGPAPYPGARPGAGDGETGRSPGPGQGRDTRGEAT